MVESPAMALLTDDLIKLWNCLRMVVNTYD
jgi:hypothetical protein